MFPAAKSLFPVKSTNQESTDTSWLQNESYVVEASIPAETSTLSKRKHVDSTISECSSENGSVQLSDQEQPKKKKKKKYDEKKKKDKHHKTEKVGSQKRDPDSQKPSTIWIEETNFAPKDAYRFDTRPDTSNFLYDTLYTGDVTNYRRRFGNYCFGLGDDVIQFTDQRNQTLKKRKTASSVQSRYFEEKLSDSSGTVLILNREGEGNTVEAKEFLVIEANPVDKEKTERAMVSPELYLMTQAAEYNTRLLDDPHNVSLWMEFIKFQDESLVWGKLPLATAQLEDAGGKAGESLRVALRERKIAIYERALEKNPLSVELLVGLMDLVQDVWDTQKLVKHWKDIVFKQPNRSLLWLKYIQFCQSRFSFYRSSSMMALYQKAINTLSSILDRSLVSHKPEPEAESKLLVVFILYCYFLQHSGFVEKGIALFQALVEFNLCSLDVMFASQNLDKARDRLDVFEAFWDEGVARVGEEGALGWKKWLELQSSGPIKDKETLGVVDMEEFKGLIEKEREKNNATGNSSSNDDSPDEESSLVKDLPCNAGWAKLETHRDFSSCLPGRFATDENEDDVDHVVLFDDITQCLFIIQDPDLKAVLMSEFLRFLGAPIQTVPHLTLVFPDLVQMIVGPCEVVKPATVPALSSSKSPCVLYQPGPAVPNLTYLHDMPFHDLLYPSAKSLLVFSPLKGFITRLFNQALSLLESLNIEPDFISSITCSWLQYELNEVLRLSLSDSLEARAAAESLQMLAIALIQSVTVSDYGFVWDLIHDLEPLLNINRKKISLLSKTFLKPFTESPTPRGSLLYVTCLLFVEYMMKVREPINCYSKHEPSNSLALFALVSLSSGEFNPTMLPISGFKTTPLQKVKAAKYFQELSSHVLSTRELSVLEIVSRLGCCFYFSYLSEGLDASCELMRQFIASFNEEDKQKSAIGCLEALFIMETKLIQVYSLSNPLRPQVLRDVLHMALDKFPSHFWFLQVLIKSEEQSFITGQLRRYFNSLIRRSSNNFVIPIVFAIKAEMNRHHRLNELTGEYLDEPMSGLLQRARAVFVRGVQSSRACPMLWRLYLKFEMDHGSKEQAKAVFYQAIHQCPWVKVLYFDGIQYFTEETEKIMEILEEKELRLRTPLEEVKLLQELN